MNEADWEKKICDAFKWKGADVLGGELMPPGVREAALRIAHEMADARTEEIANEIEAKGSCCIGNTPGSFIRHCAAIARSFILKKKTREEALEEALLGAVKRLQWHAQKSLENDEITEAAIYKAAANEVEQSSRSALEWKDTDRLSMTAGNHKETDMKKILTALSLLVLSSIASAGEEVASGSSWTNADGSVTVTVNIVQHSSANSVGVTFTSAGSSSPEATGTPGPGSSASAPTTTESGAASNSSGTFRVKDHGANSKVQKRNADGSWSDLKEKKKRSGGSQQSSYQTLQAGQLAPSAGWLHPFSGGRSVFLDAGTPAPTAGYFSPGEETTSLPM